MRAENDKLRADLDRFGPSAWTSPLMDLGLYSLADTPRLPTGQVPR